MKEIYAKEKGVFPFVEIRSADVLIFSAFSGTPQMFANGNMDKYNFDIISINHNCLD